MRISYSECPLNLAIAPQKRKPTKWDKIAFPSAEALQRTRPRSWYEVIAGTQLPPSRGLRAENYRSSNRNRCEALDRLDGLCGKAEVDEELFKNLVERE